MQTSIKEEECQNNMSKHDLIDMIITKKSKKKKKKIYTQENDDFTKEEANELLKNNNFATQEWKKIYISTISPEAKARPKPLNNENI